MPPRRGGRGRGKMRARPPQAIRNTMAELGMGSLTTFELLAKAAAAQNADAARAFFPVLSPERKANPMPLSESEKKVTQLSQDLKASINNSPCAIQRLRPQKLGRLEAEISMVKNYFCASSAKNPNNGAQSENLWQVDKCWVIPEIIPPELLPPHIRGVRTQRKRRRVVSEQDEDNDGSSEAPLLAEEGDPNGAQPERQNLAHGDDDEDADGHGGEPERAEDDDDLELDADYQTGVRFDDDDGYDDPDSGAEEATF